jgi:hypothetical protein
MPAASSSASVIFQVLLDLPRPDQVVGAKKLESAGHPAGFQITIHPHHMLQIRQLAVVDEDHQLAGLGEVGLRRQKSN